jgi:hypothetical protein
VGAGQEIEMQYLVYALRFIAEIAGWCRQIVALGIVARLRWHIAFHRVHKRHDCRQCTEELDQSLYPDYNLPPKPPSAQDTETTAGTPPGRSIS